MAQTYQQLVSLACQTAKCPGWIVQAGQLINIILSELCEGYDLDVCRGTFQSVFSTNPVGLGRSWSSGWSIGFGDGGPPGSGPYALPADWLRANRDDVFYTISGVPYVMIPIAVAEFDALVQTAGLNGYPVNYAVDNSGIAIGQPPVMFVWPPPAGAYPLTARYYRQMPDVANPETSAAVPWFPNSLYMLRRLAGEMMLLSNDDRASQFLGGEHKQQDGTVFLGAAAILDRYLKMKDDAQATKRVTLDRRFFGTNFSKLRNTKVVGW